MDAVVVNPGARHNPVAIGERDCPLADPSSIYPGSHVHELRWNCKGMEDCVRIGKIAFQLRCGWDAGFEMQSFCGERDMNWTGLQV